MSLEWKEDPSPLHLLECGESAFVGRWKLHIDKMKEVKMDSLLGGLLSNLSEKEKKVLRMRFDADGNKIDESTPLEKRRARQESHPYQWRVDYHGDDSTALFSGLGGSARTVEEGKALAQAAVEYAEMTYNALKG